MQAPLTAKTMNRLNSSRVAPAAVAAMCRSPGVKNVSTMLHGPTRPHHSWMRISRRDCPRSAERPRDDASAESSGEKAKRHAHRAAKRRREHHRPRQPAIPRHHHTRGQQQCFGERRNTEKS